MQRQQKQKYIVQKILDIKQQGNQKSCLIKWLNFGMQKATWQPFQKFRHLIPLIQEYQRSKRNDKQRNYALKQTQQINFGQNPYQETQRHGHFMYGDQPQEIVSIKVYNGEQNKSKIVICEVKWKSRKEKDQETGNQYLNVLENSNIDSKVVMEYRPDFLVNFIRGKYN